LSYIGFALGRSPNSVLYGCDHQNRRKKRKAKPTPGGSEKVSIKAGARGSALSRELVEGRAQQVATSEILRMIALSPGNLQSVMDVIAESAARFCETDDALVRPLDEDR
jgi:hypothetical protein